MRMLLIESAAGGLLTVNGRFCGPLERGGQAFPAGEDAEIYVQLSPLGRAAPLTAAMTLRGGRVERLTPRENAYALLWPDGLIQLELIPDGHDGAGAPGATGATGGAEAFGATGGAGTSGATDGLLARYLALRLAGDARARALCAPGMDAPALDGYEAVVPLRFAPLDAPEDCDLRAGLVRRLAPNIARVDAALGRAVSDGGRAALARVLIARG